jgi:hypothetical protein
MAQKKRIILGIHVKNRVADVKAVQGIFSEYGCSIKTRLGLHDVDEKSCSPSGVVLLEIFGDEKTANEMAAKLREAGKVEVKTMIFGD